MTTRKTRTRRPPVRRAIGERVRFSRRTDNAIVALADAAGVSFEEQAVALLRVAIGLTPIPA